MVAFKFFGVIMIVVSSALIGFFKSKSLVSRCKKLELIYDGVDVLYEHINQGGFELEKALKYSFSKCDFLSFESKKYRCDDGDLNKDDKLIINSFFNCVGSSVKQVECDRINAFKLKIKTRLKDAQNDRTQKCKIYQTLGICAGLVIGILLI